MAIKEKVLLGNPKLYAVCELVKQEELEPLASIVQDLHDTLTLLDHVPGYGMEGAGHDA